MSQFMTASQVWLSTRLLTPTWLFVPPVLFVLGHGLAPYQLSSLMGVYLAIVFFRCLDDCFCFQYDQTQRDLAYQEYGMKPLFVMSTCLGALYLWTLEWCFHASMLRLNVALIVVSIVLYVWLRNRKPITMVSMLKYPVLLYMINASSGKLEWLWVGGVSLYLLIREVLEEYLNIRNRKIEITVLVLLVNTKLFMRYA